MHFVTVEEQVFFAAGLHQEAISAVLVVRPHSPDQGLLHMFITFAVIGLLNCYFCYDYACLQGLLEDRALARPRNPHHRPLACAAAEGHPELAHERVDLCLFLTSVIVPQTVLLL